MCESNKELKSEIVFMFFATFLSKVLALTMDGIKDNLNHVHCCCCWLDALVSAFVKMWFFA